jgi:hypothetical protein
MPQHTRGPLAFGHAGLALTALGLMVLACNRGERPAVREEQARVTPPVDLVPDGQDANGLWLNPRWTTSAPDIDRLCQPGVAEDAGEAGSHLVFHRRPPCTSQQWLVSLNEPLTPKAAAIACLQQNDQDLIQGHINWLPATDTGTIYWEGYQRGKHQDKDYNLILVAPNRAGLTLADSRNAGLELEFNAQEVVDRFHDGEGASRSWKRIINAARGKRTADIKKALDGKAAIVTGLFGLDGVHDWHAEIHPVWAIAVHLVSAADDDVWLMFVRNLGNEGECSSGQLPYDPLGVGPALTHSFSLPWRAHATGVRAWWGNDQSKFLATDSAIDGPRLVGARGKEVRVTFRLPRATDPTQEALVYGELHLHWDEPPNAVLAAPKMEPQVQVQPGEDLQEEEHEPGELVQELLQALPLPQRNRLELEVEQSETRVAPGVRGKAFIYFVPPGSPAPAQVEPSHDSDVQISDALPIATPIGPRRQQTLYDLDVERAIAARAQELCSVLGAEIPRCKQVWNRGWHPEGFR